MLNLYIDGSAVPNPGKGGVGFVVFDEKKTVMMKGYVYLGENITNNQAEFLAVVHSLIHVINKFRPEEITINTDSELVYCAFMGTKQVRSPNLITFFDAGEHVLSFIPNVVWKKINRNENGYADALARRAVRFERAEITI